jgi:hypothetical protein
MATVALAGMEIMRSESFTRCSLFLRKAGEPVLVGAGRPL